MEKCDVADVVGCLLASIQFALLCSEGSIELGDEFRKRLRCCVSPIDRFRIEALKPAQLKGKSRLVQPYLVLGRLASRPPSRAHESTPPSEKA